jgi:hypothetical protein
MLAWINMPSLDARVENQRQSFQEAQPFRHLIFDDLVTQDRLSSLIDAFPDTDWSGWQYVSHEHQYLKQSCSDTSTIPEPLRTLIYELNSAPFLRWLSHVTSIPEILPDPNLFGGGLHVTGPGGTLTPHTDFHVVKGLPLFRRLNLLLYLNPEWSEQNGGMLELWNKDRDLIEKTILPTAGTCVLFQTDDDSMHGFTMPVAGRNRQSVAMYYYTAVDAEKFSGDGATYWRSQSMAKDTNSWLRLQTQHFLLFGSRVASSISWRLAALADRTRR